MTDETNGASRGPGSGQAMRWVLALGAVALFAGVARLAEPRSSWAGLSGEEPVGSIKAGGQGGRGAAASVQRPAARSMGELIGRDYLVRIIATDDGPRYTVCTLQGDVLETDLAAADVYRLFPGLDLESLQFGSNGPTDGHEALSGPLMLVDPSGPFD